MSELVTCERCQRVWDGNAQCPCGLDSLDDASQEISDADDPEGESTQVLSQGAPETDETTSQQVDGREAGVLVPGGSEPVATTDNQAAEEPSGDSNLATLVTRLTADTDYASGPAVRALIAAFTAAYESDRKRRRRR